MRYRDGRRSLCLSSQSGCPLTCTFCATGSMKFGRNLTASEILDQALHFRRIEPVDHVVYMGMGEPMMNIDAVLDASRRLPDVGVSHRHTTVSTVGWVPGDRPARPSAEPIRLAFSLHAPEDALRSEIMPVNERYPLAKVLEACQRWNAAKRRPVFIEYVMLAGVNDRYTQAVQLAELLDPRVFKVNLIPYNPTDSMYEGSAREAIGAFRDALEEHGLRATIRLTRAATSRPRADSSRRRPASRRPARCPAQPDRRDRAGAAALGAQGRAVRRVGVDVGVAAAEGRLDRLVGRRGS